MKVPAEVSEWSCDMARFQSFAEVVGSEELTAPLNETGKSLGRPLSEYIDLSDGSYLYEMPVTSTDQQRLRSLSELTAIDSSVILPLPGPCRSH